MLKEVNDGFWSSPVDWEMVQWSQDRRNGIRSAGQTLAAGLFLDRPVRTPFSSLLIMNTTNFLKCQGEAWAEGEAITSESRGRYTDYFSLSLTLRGAFVLHSCGVWDKFWIIFKGSPVSFVLCCQTDTETDSTGCLTLVFSAATMLFQHYNSDLMPTPKSEEWQPNSGSWNDGEHVNAALALAELCALRVPI